MYAKNPKKMMAKLEIRKFLAVLELQDNPIAPNAASTVTELTNNWKSAASERAVTASGTNPAYTISSRTIPNETAVSQAYTPTTRGPMMPDGVSSLLFISFIWLFRKNMLCPSWRISYLFQRMTSRPVYQMVLHV